MTQDAVSAAQVRWHLPEISQLANGDWGVFCQACSHEASDYVYPCPEWDEDDCPPATLRAVKP